MALKYSRTLRWLNWLITKPNIGSHRFTTINILSVITKLPFQKSHFIESWFYSAKVLKYLPQIYFQRRKTPLLVSVWPPLKHGFGIFNIHPWQLLYVKVGFRCATKHFVPYHRNWVFNFFYIARSLLCIKPRKQSIWEKLILLVATSKEWVMSIQICHAEIKRCFDQYIKKHCLCNRLPDIFLYCLQTFLFYQAL